MTLLPPPPVPADADLRHYDDMPLEVRRLRDSGIAGVADAEVFRCGLLTWCVAWHQVPAGSLPTADADLCRLVGLGRDLKTWKKIKSRRHARLAAVCRRPTLPSSGFREGYRRMEWYPSQPVGQGVRPHPQRE